MRSPLRLRQAVTVAAVGLVAVPLLAGCAAGATIIQSQMDEQVEWSENALPFGDTEGFEGAASGRLDASTDDVGSGVGLGSVPPGDYLVHVVCRGESPVEFHITSIDAETGLASTSLDCGASTSIEATTTTAGLFIVADAEGPAVWAAYVAGETARPPSAMTLRYGSSAAFIPSPTTPTIRSPR